MLIEGVKYHAEKPNMIGKTFLRLERDFDKHVTYCRDEPEAQDFLAQHADVRTYFEVSITLIQTKKNTVVETTRVLVLPCVKYELSVVAAIPCVF